MDIMSPAMRSGVMSRIRSRDTGPERRVRSILHRMGYRFRLHRKDLPGKPDIVLPRHRLVIFVHGCFWHRHHCVNGRATPKGNAKFWADKFEANCERDKRNRRQLRRLGWRVAVIWECQIRDGERLRKRLERLLQPSKFDTMQ